MTKTIGGQFRYRTNPTFKSVSQMSAFRDRKQPDRDSLWTEGEFVGLPMARIGDEGTKMSGRKYPLAWGIPRSHVDKLNHVSSALSGTEGKARHFIESHSAVAGAQARPAL